MDERTIVDNTEAGRFELHVDDAVAGFAEYDVDQGSVRLTHTVVEPQHEGQGIGSALARGALDAVRERGMTVLPLCPFIRSWIDKHPDYLDLVPADRRAEFALAPGDPSPDRP